MKREELIEKLKQGAKEILDAHNSLNENKMEALVNSCLQEVVNGIPELKQIADQSISSELRIESTVDCHFLRTHQYEVAERLNALVKKSGEKGYDWEFKVETRGQEVRLVSVFSLEYEESSSRWKDWLTENDDPDRCRDAAERGDVGALAELRNLGVPWSQDALVAAARRGHVNVVEWMVLHGATWIERVVDEAVQHGHVQVLEWAQQKKLTPQVVNRTRMLSLAGNAVLKSDLKTIANYSSNNNFLTFEWKNLAYKTISALEDQTALKVIKIIGKHLDPTMKSELAAFALEKSKWITFSFLNEPEKTFHPKTGWRFVSSAMKSGNLDTFLKIRKMHENCIKVPCSFAAESNSVELLKHLLMRNDYPFDENDCFRCAASSGALDVLKFLWENHPPTAMDKFAECAARNGHLAVLEWGSLTFPLLLKRHLSKETIDQVVTEERWDLLDWILREEFSFPMTHWLLIKAASRGKPELLSSLLLKFGEEMKGKADFMFQYAAEEGRVESIKWLLENDFGPTNVVCKSAVKKGQYKTLKWAIHNGLPISHSCVKTAVNQGELDCLKLLVRNGMRMYERDLKSAFTQQSWYMAKWMVDNGCTCRLSTIPDVSPDLLFPFKSMREIVGDELADELASKKPSRSNDQ